MYLTLKLALVVALFAYWYRMASGPGYPLLLGVYRSVDPSTYSEIYPENPDARVKEIAEAYTDLIRLLVRMCYLNEEDIHFPPHEKTPLNLSYPAKYGFKKNVVDLYQMIPYKSNYGTTNWNYGSDHGELILGGEFMRDLTDPDNLEGTWEQQIIDPFYGLDHHLWRDPDAGPDVPYPSSSWNAERGPYIRPEYAVLSDCGNHGSVMIVNTKNWHMWLVGQLGGSSDPAFEGQSDSIARTSNELDLLQYPSRPATAFFKDIIDRFTRLEWIPGGLYSQEHWKEFDQYKQFYLESGWPDNFRPDLFKSLLAQAEEENQVFRRTTGALDELNGLLTHKKQRSSFFRNVIDTEIRIAELRKRIAGSKATDEKENLNIELENEQNRLDRFRQVAYGPTPAQWEEGQRRIKEQLEQQKAERQLAINREGRFEGMTDEDYDRMMAENPYGDSIEEMEALLRDENDNARHKRIAMEARAKAYAVPKEAREKWEYEQVKWWGKSEQWLQEWREWLEAGPDVY